MAVKDDMRGDAADTPHAKGLKGYICVA